jgi:hypothetical protein
MTLLAKIEYEDDKLEVEECELDLKSFVIERLLLNEYLQETMLTSSKRKVINEQKKELSQLERSTHKKHNKSKEKARELESSRKFTIHESNRIRSLEEARLG